MTEPPAAPELVLLAIETGVVSGVAVVLPVLLVVIAFVPLNGGGPAPYDAGPPPMGCTHTFSHYGRCCSRVNTFCGIVLACATIAVPACCRIWACDSWVVAAA